MIPDFLFSSPQSQGFFFSKSLFCPLESLVSFLSESRFLPLQSPVPVLSVLFLPLKVLSPPLPPRIQKQRNDPKPSRRSWLWCGSFQNGTFLFGRLLVAKKFYLLFFDLLSLFYADVFPIIGRIIRC